VILGGFSQGSTSALALAGRNPGLADGVLMFSGFVADHPSVTASAGAGLPVFWSHGTQDQMIPYATGEAGRAALREAGAQVMAHDFQGGHTIDPEGLRQAGEWIGMVRAGAGT
jgi:phospholipase/carboxylesterase